MPNNNVVNYPENITYNDPLEFEYLNKEQQEILLDWCSRLVEIKNINKNHTSYGLKHIFSSSKDGFYISNGTFKGAMLKLGFRYLKCHPTSPNWFFNVSKKSVKDLTLENRSV